LLQNHFLGNSLDEQIFLRKYFSIEHFFGRKLLFGCKIISSKTGLQEKSFGRKFFHRLKTDLRENIFEKKNFCRKFYMVAKLFPWIQFG